MRKIQRSEILPNPEYEALRVQARQEIIAYKKIRRVSLGDLVSVVFENHRTLWFQTQEILRVEHITNPALIAEELAVYNELLPDGLTLSATLFIEIPDQNEIPAVLRRLIGVEEYVALLAGDQRFSALAEPGRTTEEKTSSVHYLTIPMGESGREALLEAFSDVYLEVSHERYQARTHLEEATVASLLADLTENPCHVSQR